MPVAGGIRAEGHGQGLPGEVAVGHGARAGQAGGVEGGTAQGLGEGVRVRELRLFGDLDDEADVAPGDADDGAGHGKGRPAPGGVLGVLGLLLVVQVGYADLGRAAEGQHPDEGLAGGEDEPAAVGEAGQGRARGRKGEEGVGQGLALGNAADGDLDGVGLGHLVVPADAVGIAEVDLHAVVVGAAGAAAGEGDRAVRGLDGELEAGDLAAVAIPERAEGEGPA